MLQGNMRDKEVRIHPTQKPVVLYEWILQKYAVPGAIILDTHVGSASSLIACTKLGFPYVGFEIHPVYLLFQSLSPEMLHDRALEMTKEK